MIVSPDPHPLREARQRSRSDHPTSAVGFCLREVRECFGVGPKALDAAQAWRDAKHQHPETNPARIPRGAPVFWTGGSGGHGHVAIATGSGECWSTDLKRPGYFDKVRIDAVASAWGLTLVGWTEDLNGVRVWVDDDKEGRGGPDDDRGVPITGATLVWAITAMFIAVVGAVVILVLALPDSQNPAALVGQLFAAFAALIGVIVTLFKVSRVERKMDVQGDQLDKVQEQTNGGLHRVVQETAYDSVRRALTDHLEADK